MDVDTLPMWQTLAEKLFDLGLAPDGCEKIPIYGTPRVWYRLGSTEWYPWLRIQHCWYLVEEFKLTIEFSHRNNTWWVGIPGVDGVLVGTFAELPTAICQAALKGVGEKY